MEIGKIKFLKNINFSGDRRHRLFGIGPTRLILSLSVTSKYPVISGHGSPREVSREGLEEHLLKATI